MGGSPCRVLILINAYVARLCHLFMPMSHVEFKKWPCRMSISSTSHVEFKKWPCQSVNFSGLGQ